MASALARIEANLESDTELRALHRTRRLLHAHTHLRQAAVAVRLSRAVATWRSGAAEAGTQQAWDLDYYHMWTYITLDSPPLSQAWDLERKSGLLELTQLENTAALLDHIAMASHRHAGSSGLVGALPEPTRPLGVSEAAWRLLGHLHGGPAPRRAPPGVFECLLRWYAAAQRGAVAAATSGWLQTAASGSSGIVIPAGQPHTPSGPRPPSMPMLPPSPPPAASRPGHAAAAGWPSAPSSPTRGAGTSGTGRMSHVMPRHGSPPPTPPAGPPTGHSGWSPEMSYDPMWSGWYVFE